ncbi:MAG: lysophospholipid acyltransferase family protein [Chloroflexota bacterium]|nr:lysophospholipid acyltransferase family protein [Chloroflexota bacterium]
MTLSQRIILTLVRILFKFFISWTWKIKGVDNIPSSGSVILISNHVNFFDPILLMLSSTRWIHFMAKEELFHNPILGFILRWAQAYPINRRGGMKERKETIKHTQNKLQEDIVLGIFPEGERSHETKLLSAKPGAAVIAARMDVQLLPVGIIGTEKIHGKRWPWQQPHIILNIGRPFNLPPTDGKFTRSKMQSLNIIMMREIAKLLPPDRQGVYAD